jgi:hypothetical protein
MRSKSILICMYISKARQHLCKTHHGHMSSHPGQGVISDRLESSTPDKPFYKRLTIKVALHSFWVCHASSFDYVTFHSSKAATKLVRSKSKFETFAAQYNIKIENIHMENGVYLVQLFRESSLK